MEQVKKEEEQEVLKCFYRTVRAVKIERTSGADFSEPRNGFMVDLYNIVFFSFLFYTLCAALKYILRYGGRDRDRPLLEFGCIQHDWLRCIRFIYFVFPVLYTG